MSNALAKKKNKLRPKGYEEKFMKQTIARNKKLSDECFMEVFNSMQLICFTVLYAPADEGGFDFSKQRLKNFNKILTRHNTEYDDGGLISTLVEQKHKENLGFDCSLEARNFPYRPKMKMLEKRLKNMGEYNIALSSINGAIETYLILAVHTLYENYKFSAEMIRQWWDKCVEVSEMYVRGMNDEFIIKYFMDECKLDITK